MGDRTGADPVSDPATPDRPSEVYEDGVFLFGYYALGGVLAWAAHPAFVILGGGLGAAWCWYKAQKARHAGRSE